MNKRDILNSMTVRLSSELPDKPVFKDGVRRAPRRSAELSDYEERLALKNALRYIPEELHKKIAPEFLQEIRTRGRIYGYRYMPTERIYGKPIDEYKGNCIQGKAFQVMIDNNLDHDVALYPYELITYGETGQFARTGCNIS